MPLSDPLVTPRGEVDVADLERIARFGGGRLRLVEAPPALTDALVELAAP